VRARRARWWSVEGQFIHPAVEDGGGVGKGAYGQREGGAARAAAVGKATSRCLLAQIPKRDLLKREMKQTECDKVAMAQV